MNKIAYGLLVTIDGKSYIELTKEKDSSQYALSAYHNTQEVIRKFSGFSNKVFSKNYESHISGSMGLLNLRPLVILFPENPQLLQKYITNNAPQQLKGQLLGAHIDFVGLEVMKEADEMSVYDICTRTINKCFEHVTFIDENGDPIVRKYNEASNLNKEGIQVKLF